MEKNGYSQRIYILEIKPVRHAIGLTVWNQGKESKDELQADAMPGICFKIPQGRRWRVGSGKEEAKWLLS